MAYSSRRDSVQPDKGSAAPALSAHGVAQRFGRHLVLRDATFDVLWGTATGLLGANGAGKTTLLRILAGSLSPTRGSISVGGACLDGNPDALRMSTALLAGESYLYDALTATENLRFAVRMTGGDASDSQIAEALDNVGLAYARDRRVRHFSSGMRKRLALARVVAMEPPVLLLDEPYASLDEDATCLVDQVVDRWRAGGRAVVMATHRRERAERVCDHCLYLVDGVALPEYPQSERDGPSRMMEVAP
ncbi:MAG: ABC transporter ATP-binding protein [Gemmatimonadota bacterium]|nr:MAG: ABC transporter ATP-binding protein [Gemmatimonadota bacterium]